MKQRYKDINFQGETRELIRACNVVVAEYEADGLTLTARQLFYQLVTKNTVVNSDKSYKRVCSAVSDGRLAGLIDWDAIEDRGREVTLWQDYRDAQHAIDSVVRGFRLQRWVDQDNYVELWVEKDALSGVLEPLASKWHVGLMVNKGYSSTSAMHAAAERFIEARGNGKECHLLYLGDHDPSGEDMVRDIDDRLRLFEADVEVTKIGLTTAQVTRYNPPPNPLKRKGGVLSDSRASAYAAVHGHSSWEVDALPPRTLNTIVDAAIGKLVNASLWKSVLAREKEIKEGLAKHAESLDKPTKPRKKK